VILEKNSNINLKNILSYLHKKDDSWVSFAILNDAVKNKITLALGIKTQIIFKNQIDFDWQEINNFLNIPNQYKFSILSYDIKNNIENLTSQNIDRLSLPVFVGFVPQIVLTFEEGLTKIETDFFDENQVDKILQEIETSNFETSFKNYSVSDDLELKSSTKDEEYLENFEHLKEHISKGDIYEINYCREFFIENFKENPYFLYQQLSEISPMPFAAMFKSNTHFLLSASPERFFKKTENKITCQPIKGTIKRGKDSIEDFLMKETLRNSEKEQSENVMIVDLMRNDLSKIAQKNSVSVTELFEIYTFNQLHQMISTIEANLKTNSWEEILKALFPMGSMTGAPKIRAMELIDKFENHSRAWYSGSVGMIKPNGDADFNVIIRSLIINKALDRASFSVGSAITSKAIAIDELNECNLKAKAITKLLKIKLNNKSVLV
jgi:para-aminobenzoate synthetase component I